MVKASPVFGDGRCGAAVGARVTAGAVPVLPAQGPSNTARAAGEGAESNPIQPGLSLALLPLSCSVAPSGRAKGAGSPPLSTNTKVQARGKAPKAAQAKLLLVSRCRVWFPLSCRELRPSPVPAQDVRTAPDQQQSPALPGANPACRPHSLPVPSGPAGDRAKACPRYVFHVQ